MYVHTCTGTHTHFAESLHTAHSLNGCLGAVAVGYWLWLHNYLSESSSQCPAMLLYKRAIGRLIIWFTKKDKTVITETEAVACKSSAPHYWLNSELTQHHDSLFASVESVYVIPMCCRWSWGESWQCGQPQEAGWGLAGGPVPCQQWQSCEFLCQRHG